LSTRYNRNSPSEGMRLSRYFLHKYIKRAKQVCHRCWEIRILLLARFLDRNLGAKLQRNAKGNRRASRSFLAASFSCWKSRLANVPSRLVQLKRTRPACTAALRCTNFPHSSNLYAPNKVRASLSPSESRRNYDR